MIKYRVYFYPNKDEKKNLTSCLLEANNVSQAIYMFIDSHLVEFPHNKIVGISEVRN